MILRNQGIKQIQGLEQSNREIEALDVFTNEPVERERPMSNKERRNKRELEELERIQEPKNKRRKVFQGTYF
ncbi:hypothetical protein QVD99_006471 [Batrachochytrium dendrobatidis]|nr:hypothetical protein QVD99_006471 [Batrachochytrium dendrobatidis]